LKQKTPYQHFSDRYICIIKDYQGSHGTAAHDQERKRITRHVNINAAALGQGREDTDREKRWWNETDTGKRDQTVSRNGTE